MHGFAEFNRVCVESAGTYAREWCAFIERLGYRTDIDQANVTFTNEYVESDGWSFAELWRKNRLAKGYTIQPCCARCSVTRPYFEVTQTHKEADDLSVWALFPARAEQTRRTLGCEAWTDPDRQRLLAWTTTPCTPFAHVGLAVHPKFVYHVLAHPAQPGTTILLGNKLGGSAPFEMHASGSKRQRVDLRDQPALGRFRERDLESLRYERVFGAPFEGSFVPVLYGSLFTEGDLPLPENPSNSGQLDPHRPYIYEFVWSCKSCGTGRNEHEADVIGARYDSGAKPLHSPFENREFFARPAPADLVTDEGENAHGWLNLLFDSLAYNHGIVPRNVNEDQGRKPSEFLGNVVQPMNVVAKTAADALRFFFCAANPGAASYFLARLENARAEGYSPPLWNALAVFTNYANKDGWRSGQATGLPIVPRTLFDCASKPMTAVLNAFSIIEAGRHLSATEKDRECHESACRVPHERPNRSVTIDAPPSFCQWIISASDNATNRGTDSFQGVSIWPDSVPEIPPGALPPCTAQTRILLRRQHKNRLQRLAPRRFPARVLVANQQRTPRSKHGSSSIPATAEPLPRGSVSEIAFTAQGELLEKLKCP